MSHDANAGLVLLALFGFLFGGFASVWCASLYWRLKCHRAWIVQLTVAVVGLQKKLDEHVEDGAHVIKTPGGVVRYKIVEDSRAPSTPAGEE